MRLNFIKLKEGIFFLLIISFTLFGCGNGKKKPQSAPAPKPKIDSAKSTLLKVNGQIFSVPSPIQTAFLIKKSGAQYDKTILNTPQKEDSYVTNYQKALNLGIYGADLGYVTLYDQTQDAIMYMKSVKKLADDLGVSGAFSPETIKRFEKNIGNKDSLLVLVSVAYRASDAYLKNNQRNDMSSLILAGGWIESLYFATKVSNTEGSPDVIKRIGEQKSSLESLLKIMAPYSDKPEYSDLIKELKDLETIFQGVKITYTYVKPTIDVKHHLTTINSKTEVNITPDQIKAITKKIQSIRNKIVG